MFWFLDKKTDKARIFGSIAEIANQGIMKASTLYSHFSAQKKSKYEDDNVRIEDVPVERSERKKK